MATSLGLFDYGKLKAAVDMSNRQYRFVTTGSVAGEFTTGSSASAPIAIGVLQNDPVAGEPGVIRIYGTTKVQATGNAIAFGDFVTTSVCGYASVTTGCAAVGVALEAYAAGSGFIEILLTPGMTPIGGDNTP